MSFSSCLWKKVVSISVRSRMFLCERSYVFLGKWYGSVNKGFKLACNKVVLIQKETLL